MRCRGVADRRLPRCLVLILLAARALAGCTYNPQEPGLFGRETAPPTAAPASVSETPTETPPSGNRELPVVGEAVWTSGDGLDITIRLAVHAVRRIEGRRLLDGAALARIEERLDAERESRRLHRAIAELPEDDRALLELVSLDGLSTADAARVLGVKPATARVRLHRSRARVTARLHEMGEIQPPDRAFPVEVRP